MENGDEMDGVVIGGGAAARREQNRREMRIAILDTARSIVDEHGADKLTIRGIAQRLGYSAGAIYDYIPSKDHILQALYFLGTDGLGQQMEKAVAGMPDGTSTIDAILTLAHTYRAYAHAHVDLYWLAFSGLKERPTEDAMGDMMEEAQGVGFGPLMEIIVEGIGNGTLIDTVYPMAIAIATWSAVHGFVSLELSGHMKPDVLFSQEPVACPDRDGVQMHDDMFDVLIRMVLYGFVRRPPVEVTRGE
ncbi:MAG: TetR/AcrR family transcriptional regulator [Thermomicrobiales bacterium]